jgi:hypothetical protein
MKALAGSLVLSLAYSISLVGQERERSLERNTLALQQPRPIVRGIDPVDTDVPKTLGIFTLVPPTKRGEIVRVAVPIGELVSRAFKGVAAANQRRQEAAARRQVEEALRRFAEQQPASQR